MDPYEITSKQMLEQAATTLQKQLEQAIVAFNAVLMRHRAAQTSRLQMVEKVQELLNKLKIIEQCTDPVATRLRDRVNQFSEELNAGLIGSKSEQVNISTTIDSIRTLWDEMNKFKPQEQFENDQDVTSVEIKAEPKSE